MIELRWVVSEDGLTRWLQYRVLEMDVDASGPMIRLDAEWSDWKAVPAVYEKEAS